MNRYNLCALLNGREYRNEIDDKVIDCMRGTDLVVVFGYSDDGMGLYGAGINDEIGCYGGGMAHLTKDGLVENKCDDDLCPYHMQLQEQASVIEALWCQEPNISWTYKTDIPHSTFTIMEEGEEFCRGIVFNLSKLKVM